MPTIIATEAKRSFGTVLDHVSRGEVFTVVRRGSPVGRIVPLDYQGTSSQLGALSAYANPIKREREATAFAEAMEAKHDYR